MESKEAPTSALGKICYVEFPATEPTVSSSFYRDLFGWKIRHRDDGHLAFDDGFGVSGTWVKGRKAWTEPGMLFYIMVEDMEQTLERARALGAEVVQAIGVDHPEITARFRDPGGNIIGLYQEPVGP